jgi:hypothetical protein
MSVSGDGFEAQESHRPLCTGLDSESRFVRLGTDGCNTKGDRGHVSKEGLRPWSDAVVCPLCERRILPLSCASVEVDDTRWEEEDRPDLKCAGCGQWYQWHGSAGWAPLGSPLFGSHL